MTRAIRLTLAACALSCAGSALVHAEPAPGGRMRGPAFMRELFPPTLIMRHQQDIGLSDTQRQAITKEMTQAHASLLDVRWQLEEKTAALTKLLAADRVDEAAALAQADEVIKLEDRMKRQRLASLIRLKNVLTPAQQTSLRNLAATERRGERGPDADDPMAPGALEP